RACRAPASQRRADPGRRPRLGRPRLLRQQVPQNPAPRPPRVTGPALHRRLRRGPRLLAVAGGDSHRPVSRSTQPHRLAPRPPARPDRPDQKLLRPKIATEIPKDVNTLPEILSAAGYTCGHIGKWHLGGKGAAPTNRGFHTNIAGDETGTPLSYFAPFKNPA